MYDLSDIQVLFDSKASIQLTKDLLNDLGIVSTFNGSYYLLTSVAIIPLHKIIIVVRPNQPKSMYYINNRSHIEKLQQELKNIISSDDSLAISTLNED